MNDSLALDPSADQRSILASLIKPTLAASLPNRRKSASLSERREDEPASPPSPAALIIGRLRAGAPALIDRASIATQARFTGLVSKRLVCCVGSALVAFQGEVGELAASLDPGQRLALQDLALTVRPSMDDLVGEAAAAITPSELVAILADACEAHAPDGIDSLRCRDFVYAAANPLAREAMLDLARFGATHASDRVLDDLVAAHMIEAFAASPSLSPTTIEKLRERAGKGRSSEGDGAAGARGRIDGSLSAVNMLVKAVAEGSSSASALLASAARVPREIVDAAICLRTAKGLVSLAWRAGFDPELSVTIQRTLGRLPPEQILRPIEPGVYPLTEAEMLWQCRFLARTQHAFTAG